MAAIKAMFKEPTDEEVESQLVPELFEYNAAHSPDYPMFLYEETIGSGTIRTIDWKTLNEACKMAADVVSSSIGAWNKQPVVGVLANLDSITYTALFGGIWITGAIPFLISTRNSAAAVAHLLSKTNASALFVSPDEQMQGLASTALYTLAGPENGDVPSPKIKVFPTPKFGELFATVFKETAARKMPAFLKEEHVGLILHSSGSTAFPKPISLTYRSVCQWLTSQLQPDATLPVRKLRLACQATPLFHGMGLGVITCALRSGCVLAVFPPSDPPITPAPNVFLNSAVAMKCDVLYTVPSFLELWSREPSDIEKLKTFRVIAFGGGPLGRDVGNSLWEQGANILNLYGATEFGGASRFYSIPYAEWEWITLAANLKVHFRPLEDQPGEYELVFLKGAKHSPSVFNCEIDGVEGYATNDVVIRHPTDSMMVKIMGRVDDQIMLSTGEKTNPGPLEAIISRNRLVSAAIMFGRGRDQNGVIVKPVAAVIPTDEAAVVKFRNDIWPSVEEANIYAPSHSRIFKEMIIVANPLKPFHLTPKNTIKRKPTLSDYEAEIDAIYLGVEQSSQRGILGPSQWDEEGLRDFVRRVVFQVMERQIGDDDDLFLHGGNSLRATWIRNSLLHTIRQSQFSPRVHDINQGFVYAHPTIAKLVAALVTVAQISRSSVVVDEVQRGVEEIEALVAVYTKDFPIHQAGPIQFKATGEVVLVTGTTGGLGAQLVATLAAMPAVSRIYALNRPAKDPLKIRQWQAFSERGLDTRILEGGKVVLVEGSAEKPGFGIPKEVYDEMRDSITLIIHNAWRVNFVLEVSAFAPLLKGTRNIVDFSLSSPRDEPPRIIFTSSVGVFMNWDSDKPPFEGPVEARIALGNGYARSKYIAERILEAAEKATALRPIIVRVGQMTSTASGAWNKTDWLPAIVRSGQVIGALPDRNDSVAWFPLELAANALYEFRTTRYTHLNLEYPTPYTWSSIFGHFSRRLNVPLRPWTEWLDKLVEAAETDVESAKTNPAAMLIAFFKGAPSSGQPGKEAPGNVPFLSLEKALESSETLRKAALETVDVEGDSAKWVAHWKVAGLLD